MNMNKTETKKHPEDVFDHNFEVIYEGELPELPNDLGNDDYKDVLSNLSELDTTKSLGIDYLEQNRTKTFTGLARSGSRHGLKKAEVKKIHSAADLFLLAATLLIIAVITGLLAVNFWKHNSSFADVTAAAAGYNYIPGAYYGTALFIILTEWIAFLNVLLGGNAGKWHGMFSFLIIYLGSVLSRQFHRLIPSSPVLLQGIQEALNVYGSLSHILLPLCTAGCIICVIRKVWVK